MHLLYNLKLVYNGVLLSLISFVMFGMLSALFVNSSYIFKHDIKQTPAELDSFNEEFTFKFINGELKGSYSLTQFDDMLMYIDYNGYYLKFFSNYIMLSIASSRSNNNISSRFIVKIFKISSVDNIFLLEATIPPLIMDNIIVRKSRISFSGKQSQ